MILNVGLQNFYQQNVDHIDLIDLFKNNAHLNKKEIELLITNPKIKAKLEHGDSHAMLALAIESENFY